MLAIACGGHAGDAESMARVLRCCRDGGPRAGAHPSYPDREGFGRRSLAIEPATLAAAVEAQCRALDVIARGLGVRVEYVKPHGALYHDANRDPALARAVIDGAVAALGVPSVIGPTSGALRDAAVAAGLPFLCEAFADRRLTANGTLVPRSEPGALITDPTVAVGLARFFADGGQADAICVHGDTPGALAIARAVRAALAAWQPLGDRAVRFARPSGSPRSVMRAIRSWPHVLDVVIAQRDVAVYFDREPELDNVRIRALVGLPDDVEPAREHELRCIYDGPDLDEVARRCELSVAEVIARHASATYVVETIGFAPGFAYLAGLDAKLELPRRATPRPRVPAGSLAIAGRHTAVYPFDSPGGWHLLGRVTDGPMFDERGARLAHGDRVRFVR